MQVFLIRHPRPLIEAGVCYGRLDIDCEDPLPVAARLKAILPPGIPVISSPLRRARRLAEGLADNVRIDDRLAEINFGDWEGKRWDDIERKAIDAWATDVSGFTPPGGESVADLQRRVIGFADSLDCSRVVLVSHAGVLRALIGYWRRLPFAEWSQLTVDFGSITQIEIDRGTGLP